MMRFFEVLMASTRYWDTDAKLLGEGTGNTGGKEQGIDHQTMMDHFRNLIVKGNSPEVKEHQFILKPVSGRAGLEMDKTGKTDRPQTKARLLFNELGFVLDDEQYRDALMLVDLFHYFIRHQEYRKWQPAKSPKEDPRAWLRFAVQAVVDRLPYRHRRYTWEYFAERRDDRKRYIALFKKKKKEEKLTPDESKDLDALEHKLSYDDLRFWRSLARNELRKENVGVKKQEKPKSTWASYIWGTSAKQEEQTPADDDTQMTEAQRKELYQAIDFDEKKSLTEAVDVPKEAVKLQVDMNLKTGSFTLRRDPHGKRTDILRLLFDDFSTEFVQRTDSMVADLSLGGMRLYDGSTEGNMYEQMLHVKDAPPVRDEERVKELGKTGERKDDEDEREDEDEEQDPFFSLSYEKNPLDGRADQAVNLKLKAMEIVYNPNFVVQVTKFFKPPERQMESIGALLETAGETVEGLRQQTRAGLEFALQEHKSVDVRLDLQAPLIIIPDSVTRRSAICLILDAGHASVRSDLVDPATLADVEKKQRQQYTEQDFRQLESLMYDKFQVRLEATQVLIGTTVEETKRQLAPDSPRRDFHLVDRINMDFMIEASIVPKAADLTKFRVTGHLPVLRAILSDAKYKALMKVIDFAVPKFEADEIPEAAERPGTAIVGAEEKAKRRRSALPPSDGARPRGKSFQASRQELVMDEEIGEEEQKRKREAQTAPPLGTPTSGSTSNGKKAMPTVNLAQRNFEFKFTVDRLQGSLFQADADGKKEDRLLVDLIAETFHFEFYQRAYDMVADVKLRALTVEDHVEEAPAPEFRNLISSEDVYDNKAADLAIVHFQMVNREHPEFESRFEGIRTNLDVAVSTINLMVTRRTLLTLLDFVLNTFASPAGEEGKKGEAKVEEVESESEEEEEVPEVRRPVQQQDKIRIKTELHRIAVILNNDGIRLATLSLTSAEVSVFLAGATMQVHARLGNLGLVDDVNQGVSAASDLRQLVSIQGDELADFRYDTFDPAASATYPGHDTAIMLRAGSLKVNFMTEPFRKIMEFGVKFGKMQAIFNAARQAAASRATKVQQNASKMHFDVLVKTPIVAFPRMVITENPQRDTLTAYLGEIYASNAFVPLEGGGNDVPTANKLSAGIRNVRLTSTFHYEDQQTEELEMIDNVGVDFNITQIEHRAGGASPRPDMEVEGSMSNVNLRITQAQLKFVMELTRNIPQAFALEADEEVEEEVTEDLPDEVVKPAREVQAVSSKRKKESPVRKGREMVATTDKPSHLGPELGSDGETWTKLDLIFKVGAIGLELVNAQADEPVNDLEAASLSKFSLNETNAKLRMLSDGAVEGELLIQSFTITDTRSREKNKFRRIMSLINTEVKQQFMASISVSGGEERSLIALLTIDSPRVIFALDYLFSLMEFAREGLAGEEALVVESEDEEGEGEVDADVESEDIQESVARKEVAGAEAERVQQGEGSMSISYRVNVVDAQVVLIANPAISHSEAIVLGTKQVLVSQQHAMTLQVEKVGMFLCRMDQFETTQLRILDDFSIQTSLDMRSHGKDSSLTSIHVDIEPLVLRLSLRDILLAMQIVNRASAMSGDQGKKMEKEGPKKIAQIKADTKPKTEGAKSGKRTAGASTSRQKPAPKTISTKKSAQKDLAEEEQASLGSAVLKREEMKIQMDGVRVVLIGDLHELPILDWSVKKFSIDVRDWTGAMTADTSVETFFNVYNFAKSAWEPLIEPWALGFHMAKEINPQKLSVELYSRKMLELTITSATIALASKSTQYLSSDEDVLSKPRGNDAPYCIRNYTGFQVNVWTTGERGEEGQAAKLEDGEEQPWRFEDPTTTRETLSPEGQTGLIGVRLEGSGFDSIDRIPVNREGEQLYNLKPRKDRVQHRMLVEVTLGMDNVKYITLRSPLLVENNTHIPVELGVYSPDEGHLLKIEKIAPGESRPSPVGAAFMHSLVIRPDQGFGYTWSNERLFWKDLLKRPIRTLTCASEQEQQGGAPPFYFQMQAVYVKSNPLTSVYPYMRIRLSAPVVIQNLLPYDFKYRIYDKNTKKDWTNFLRKGGESPVHVVELSHLLLMSVDLQDTPFRASEFAIINTNNENDFRREKHLLVKDNNNLELRLRIHYYNLPDSGGAFRITMYSPYVILNRTGLELDIRSKAFFGSTKSAAGQQAFTDTEADARKAQPFMFSYPTNDQKNRALIKIGDSRWSQPVSFDAIGANVDVKLPAQSGRAEMHAGLNVMEGEGKYKLTKVVTITPRFIVKNRLAEEVQIREPGSSDAATLKPGELHPLRFLKQTTGQQLCLCFPGVNNSWSSPFNIANVGSVHVKLAKSGERQKLIRVEILMEQAMIFLHLSLETRHWPFSMRNESDQEFLFWQANPNVDEDEEDRTSGWKPIRYRLPPRSIMPYAWDYPAAKNKSLVLSGNGKERHVKLAEIGNLIPMRIPTASGQTTQKIIDLNVVADGPTQTLLISNYKPSKSLYRQKSPSASASTTAGFEVKEQDTDVTMRAMLRFAGIGISLVNTQLRELVYVTWRDIELKYMDSPLYQTVALTVKWIQIDNQLYGGIFPLIFYPSVVPKTGKEMEAHPIFRTTFTRVKDDSYGVLYIKYFTFLMQQMTIEIDEDFIFALLDFTKVPGASWTEQKEGKLAPESLDVPEPQQEQSGQDIYFELLHLQPMQFDLSFVRTERINAEDTSSSSTNPFMFAVNVLTMSIGNVNDAPIRYNALMLENARLSVGALISNIRSHYVQESLRQIHVVLGSADFLGNPVGLFNNLSSGVADIFYEPYQGLVTDRPQDLGIGIAKGASSFVKKSIFGFSDSVSKFTGSISKGLAAASMDKEFQDQRRMSRSRNRPKHALYGITSGGNAFASSLASGIGGLARAPMQGAEKEGAAGFVKGVGKGLLGLATKPAIGAFDLASNLAEGVKNTTTVFDQEGLDRVRLPRFIAMDGIVRPYSQREALGQFWLKTIDNGKYFNDSYIAHLELNAGSQGDLQRVNTGASGRSGGSRQETEASMLVIITYNAIMLVRARKLTTEWEVPLKDIQTISKERTGMSIVLKGGTNGPFIPIADEGSRNWLYKQVAVAVNAYNDKWNAKG